MVDYNSRRVTLNDVAAVSGVSYQTVSRVINNHPNVAEETRTRVLDAISKLDYRPNRMARSLAAKRSNTLAVVTFGMNYHGPAQMMIHVERAARSAGYDLIFSNISDLSNVQDALSQITQWQVDGILVIIPTATCSYEELSDLSRVPIVLIDPAQGQEIPSVTVDQYAGSRMVTQHLIDLGHRHISEISGPLDWHGATWYGALARHQAWEDTLREANITPGISVQGDWSVASGYEMAQYLIHQKTQFTALVVGNDQMALGAMRALRHEGFSIPDDLSIVGFDNMPESAYFESPLTTIHQDFDMLGKQGVEYLIEQINAPEISMKQRLIQPHLIIRESTAPPKSHSQNGLYQK